MRVSRDRSGINIKGLTKREVWSLKITIERELNWAKEYKNNIKVNNLKNLDLHIEILEKFLKELNSVRNNN